MSLPPGTLTRQQWNARPAKRTPHRIAMRDRPGVETHHTAGAVGTSADRWARDLQAFHQSHPTVNYSDVWYSLGIWIDGTPVELRGVQYRSAPTDSLTVVFAGNYDSRHLTDEQKRTWLSIRSWARAQGCGTGRTYHGQRMKTGCPGRTVIAWHNDGYPSLPQEDPDMTPNQEKRLHDRLDAIEAKVKATNSAAGRAENLRDAIAQAYAAYAAARKRHVAGG